MSDAGLRRFRRSPALVPPAPAITTIVGRWVEAIRQGIRVVLGRPRFARETYVPRGRAPIDEDRPSIRRIPLPSSSASIKN